MTKPLCPFNINSEQSRNSLSTPFQPCFSVVCLTCNYTLTCFYHSITIVLTTLIMLWIVNAVTCVILWLIKLSVDSDGGPQLLLWYFSCMASAEKLLKSDPTQERQEQVEPSGCSFVRSLGFWQRCSLKDLSKINQCKIMLLQYWYKTALMRVKWLNREPQPRLTYGHSMWLPDNTWLHYMTLSLSL